MENRMLPVHRRRRTNKIKETEATIPIVLGVLRRVLEMVLGGIFLAILFPSKTAIFEMIELIGFGLLALFLVCILAVLETRL